MPNATLAWMRIWSFAMAATGVLLVLSAFPPLDWPAALFIDIAYWPVDGSPALASSEGRLLAVISGAVTAGWCLLVGLLAGHSDRTGDTCPVRLALASLAVWFVLDCVGSIAIGAWMNVAMNAVILGGFLVPAANQGFRAPST